jgi:hypothetical protein
MINVYIGGGEPFGIGLNFFQFGGKAVFFLVFSWGLNELKEKVVLGTLLEYKKNKKMFQRR